MSNEKNPNDDLSSSYSFNNKQQEIIEYLEEKTEDVEYLKSKDIADDLKNLTRQEIGSNMLRIANVYGGLKIERWSESSDITWRIVRE